MQRYNGKDLQLCYFEDQEISKITFGEFIVWEGQRVIDLGTGRSWDIKTLYPSLYSKLTANNFFFYSANSASITDSIRMRDTDTERQRRSFSGGIRKSYNPETGVLSAYLYAGNTNNSYSYGNVRMALVTRPEKLIYLGNGYSFNVKSRSEYQSFTSNNFLISSATDVSWGAMFYPQGYTYDDSGRATISVSKSYNASTGVLSGSINLSSVDTSGVYNWYNASSSGTIAVYLNPKV